MTRRLILCEGPDDLNALRAIALHVHKGRSIASSGRQGGGDDRRASLQVGEVVVDIVVPSKGRGAPGDGKSALPRMLAEVLRDLPPQLDPADEARLGVVGVVFDPDEKPVPAFHTELEISAREHAEGWTLTGAGEPGVWRAQRGPAEQVEVRAVDWRGLGGVVDGLPDEQNLERLLCSVLAKAYPDDALEIQRWLSEIGEVRRRSNRKPPKWKAAIHLWLALVYEKVDELNAASRVLHQQAECKPHVEGILDQVGLLRELGALLGPG